jgi:hypothetical protein
MYKHPDIVPVEDNQFDKRVIPLTCFEKHGKVMDHTSKGKVVIGDLCVTGYFDVYEHGVAIPHEFIEVTMLGGSVVPCFRRKSHKDDWVICQNFQFHGVYAPEPEPVPARKRAAKTAAAVATAKKLTKITTVKRKAPVKKHPPPVMHAHH